MKNNNLRKLTAYDDEHLNWLRIEGRSTNLLSAYSTLYITISLIKICYIHEIVTLFMFICLSFYFICKWKRQVEDEIDQWKKIQFEIE